MFGQDSTELRSTLGLFLVGLRLKGGVEAGCLLDESCLEQSVSQPDGCFELSNMGLGAETGTSVQIAVLKTSYLLEITPMHGFAVAQG